MNSILYIAISRNKFPMGCLVLKSTEIINDLIRQILSGELPTSNQLAIKYKCNRHTIRKVINHLVERNYLIKTTERITYVNNPTLYNNILFISAQSDLYNPNTIQQ